MTIFSFDVDADHARQNNELLKDARRLQISAVLFAAILVGVGVWLHRLLGAGHSDIGRTRGPGLEQFGAHHHYSPIRGERGIVIHTIPPVPGNDCQNK